MALTLSDATFLLSETDPARLGPCAAELAFVGRSNVGKSTLLNALCGRELARVSRTPGRTRTINVFLAGRDRWLVDLPGYGFAHGPAAEAARWSGMLESYLAGRPSLRTVFALVDAEVGPTKLDLQMLGWLKSRSLRWRAIATKTDRVRPSRRQARRLEVARGLGLAPADIGWVSASAGDGIRELRGEALALLGG
ncbi:MAG: ribosome biogenesis GTP-binding protein YsxC [Elusimicrobia bacterium]|nr:ribosome biogenesis GTP-binding protein YsxC [Elusimicrobiota bacterium]